MGLMRTKSAHMGTRSCQQECTEVDKEDIKSTESDEQIARTKTGHRKGHWADIRADRSLCGAHFWEDFPLTHRLSTEWSQTRSKRNKKASGKASGIGCALGVTWKKGSGLEGFQGINIRYLAQT